MITQEQELAILKAASLGITQELDKAMEQLKELIRSGVPARDAVERVLQSFDGKYKEVLGTAFSGILQQSIGGAGLVKDLVVSGMSLSTRLHVQAETVAAVVADVVRRHDEGFASTRKLALEIYEGYGFREKEKLEVTQSNKELPQYLRTELLTDATTRGELARYFARMQAERLRTPALKAAYMEYLEAIEKGVGFDLLEKKLQTAFHERMRYFANRIAQTELHRAYTHGLSREYMQDKGIAIVKYRLSPTHPVDDICDLLAHRDLYGLGPGLYPKELCPVPPVHPFCRCLLAPQHWGLKRKWKLNPNADRQYLQSLDPKEAARIMGSRAKRDQVLGGGMATDVWNRNQPAMYGIQVMGDVVKNPGLGLDVGMSDKNLARNVMPNVDEADISLAKVKKYVLNFESEKGKDKARVLSAAFGLTDSEEDVIYFMKALKDGLPGSTVTREFNTEWGKRFEVGIAVTGKNGHTESVHTAWQYDKGSSTPRLLTAFLEGKKK